MGNRLIKTGWLLLLAVVSIFYAELPAYASPAAAGFAGDKNAAVMAKAVKMQMPFIANEGQVGNKSVRFYAKTFGGTVFVTEKGELVYSLPESKSQASIVRKDGSAVPTATGSSEDKRTRGVALKEFFVGARVAGVAGEEKAATKVNYFSGSDQKQWKSNIPTYESVSLGEIFPRVSEESKR